MLQFYPPSPLLTQYKRIKNNKQQIWQLSLVFSTTLTSLKMFLAKTHYQTLEISPLCSVKEIKTAFKKQIRKHHPDKNISHLISSSNCSTQDKSLLANKQKKEISMQIIEAYQCLMDPQRRKSYDHQIKVQTVNFHLKQTRHKDTISLSENSYEQKLNKSQIHTQTKQISQENTSQQQEQQQNTILVCQQCFGENEIPNDELKDVHKVQISINCQHCGIYMTILD